MNTHVYMVKFDVIHTSCGHKSCVNTAAMTL